VTLKYESDEKLLYYDNVNDVYKLTLTSDSSQIKALSSNDNIYVLIDSEEDKILYIGKSVAKDIDSRLAEHLLKNEKADGTKSGTSSKIKEVYTYLMEQVEKEKVPKIRYYTFEVVPKKLYAAVEGHLINYLKEVRKQAKWNIRNG
jgi:hypothetical protein